MTSTAAGSSSELLDEIKALFSWNPPHLVSAKKGSTATRPPSFYDKHFSDKLVLRRVERFPSLVQQLANNVDTALDAALKTLPPLDDFITADQRARDVRRLSKVVQDEKAVANFYHQTTARYCTNVASTLILHPAASFSKWDGLLLWTQSVSSSGYAIMDGMLCFMPEDDQTPDEGLAAIAESIEEKNRIIFEKMRKSRRPLATWEIKSTSTGPVEVMTAVRNLGKFSWTTCNAIDCTMDFKHQQAKEKVAQVVIGPDALAPPWHLPVDGSLHTSLVPEHHDEAIDIQPLASHATLQHVTGRVTRSAARTRSSTLPPPLSPSRSSAGGPLTKDKGKKRMRDEEDEDEEGAGEEEDEAYKDRSDLTAQSLVQQAWAQAVRVDGTVIVLYSGNHELVCVRHRATQTLYVSDVIEPPNCVNPGYGKLHIGIYIAAIQETIDRQLQSQLKPPGDGGSDLVGGDKDQDRNRGSGSGRKDGHGHRRGRRGGGHGVRKSGRFQGSAGREGPADDERIVIEKAIHVANNRDVVLLYLQYSIYDSPIPASFLRFAPPIMACTTCPTPPFSPRAIHTCRLEECLTIVLTSEIGRGATGVVHRGTLKVDLQSGTMALDVVVKLAFDTEQQDALRNEYEVYRHLRSKGVRRGIATTLGIFNDSEGAACALVMVYAGVPLCEESQGNLSISDRESALSTLKSIHCADILHGDVRRENILIGDSGVTIVDFGHSKQCGDQRDKNREFVLLRNFLGLAGKSH